MQIGDTFIVPPEDDGSNLYNSSVAELPSNYVDMLKRTNFVMTPNMCISMLYLRKSVFDVSKVTDRPHVIFDFPFIENTIKDEYPGVFVKMKISSTLASAHDYEKDSFQTEFYVFVTNKDDGYFLAYGRADPGFIGL